MKIYRATFLFALVALALMCGGIAQAANTVSGSLWVVADSVAQNAIPANVPAPPPDVTFDVNSPLNFNNGGSRLAFLNSGGAFNILGSASVLAAGISPSIIDFRGFVSVTNNQQFTVTHDDGLTLIIGGLSVISTPGPTGPVQTTATYTGPTGNFPFELVYGECCGGSAVLQVDLPFTTPPTSTPEPATMLLVGLGLAGVAAARRKINK